MKSIATGSMSATSPAPKSMLGLGDSSEPPSKKLKTKKLKPKNTSAKCSSQSKPSGLLAPHPPTSLLSPTLIARLGSLDEHNVIGIQLPSLELSHLVPQKRRKILETLDPSAPLVLFACGSPQGS